MAGYSQFAPGLPANFGIDGDVLSGKSQNISGKTPEGSFDWFQMTGTGAKVGYGIIDTTGASKYSSEVASGHNFSFNKGMAYSGYSKVNGFLLLDARYSRDNFGISAASGLDDSTTFTGGSKNGDNPSTWITSPAGSTVADKTDIIDSYVTMLRNGSIINNTNPSHLIMAMGVSTLANTGNRYIDFELFRSRIAYDITSGVFSNSGPSASGGHTPWLFNADGTVNNIGDLSVSFTYSTAGVSAISTYIWVSLSTFNTSTPSNFNFVSGQFYGSTYGYAQVVPITSTNFQAWGSVSSDTTGTTPWGTNSKSVGGAPTQYYSKQYGANDFGEVAVDFTSMGIDPALSVGMNPCNPPYTRVMIKSRSSASFNSALQDFSGPYVFLDAPIASAQIATPAVLNCNVSNVTLSPAVPVNGANYQWTTSNGNILTNPNNADITVNKPGEYYLTSSIISGCPTKTDSTNVGGDYYRPVATASQLGQLVPDPTIYVNLIGGDSTASNHMTPFGGSAGLSWNWTGPGLFAASTRNTVANAAGSYVLIVTEIRNGCKDTATISLASASALPVKYSSFNAVAEDNKSIKISWVTDFEQTNSHFELQRSFDSKNFKTIGIVLNGVAIGATQISYEFIDNRPELQNNPVIYYRLNQVDIDGTETFTKILAVQFQPASLISMQISPNPFTGSLTMRFHSIEKGSAEIRIMNSSGQLICSKQSTISAGNYNIGVEGLINLTSGFYIAQLIINGKVIGSEKLIKNQ